MLIARLKAAEGRIADKDTTISEQRVALDDLRHRLSRSEDERARAQAQLTALLANQRSAYRGGMVALAALLARLARVILAGLADRC